MPFTRYSQIKPFCPTTTILSGILEGLVPLREWRPASESCALELEERRRAEAAESRSAKERLVCLSDNQGLAFKRKLDPFRRLSRMARNRCRNRSILTAFG